MNASTESRKLADLIREKMIDKHYTLSTAESCTSGRIAAILTSVSGASDYFQGGMVVYQDQLKERFLGVSEETIKNHDVVSREVVEQMVRGCCKLFNTDFAIASTGYTGGGSDKVPSGTVWIGWGSKDEVHTFCLTEDKGREQNTSHAAANAVKKFYSYVERI